MAIKTKKANHNETIEKWPYGKKNYIIFALAIVVISIGFFILGAGSTTWSVILLVLGYCVLIPAALIIKGSDDTDEDSENSKQSA